MFPKENGEHSILILQPELDYLMTQDFPPLSIHLSTVWKVIFYTASPHCFHPQNDGTSDSDVTNHKPYKHLYYHFANTLVDSTSMNEECIAVDAVGSMPKLQPRVDRQVCAVRFFTCEDVAPRRPTSPTNVLRTQWQGISETIGEYGRHMERLAGSVSPGFGSEFSFS